MREENIPRLSPKEALILHLLIAHGELYGLELVKRSTGKLKRGTVYVTLLRMENDKGFVKSRAGSPGPRRVFEATGLGRRVLAAWEMAGAAFSHGAV